MKDTVAKQVCKEVHYMVKYRDMAGQECKHGPMDMVNDFKLLGWENKVTEWDDWTGAMTLLCLQEVDRASKRGQTQSTQSMASKHVPINQIKKNGIEEVTNPTTRAQPSLKDRRVLLKTTSDCYNSLRSNQLCDIGSVGGVWRYPSVSNRQLTIVFNRLRKRAQKTTRYGRTVTFPRGRSSRPEAY